jgi:hypothetical protein
MSNKSMKRGQALILWAAALMMAAACGGNGKEEDADADDVPVGDIDGADDVVHEDVIPDTPQEDTPAEPDGEDTTVEDAVEEDVVEEDVVEEELPPVECPVGTAGTASLGGYLTRGTNMNVDDTDTNLDAAGPIMIAVFDADPASTLPRPTPVATALVTAAVLTEETDAVQYCVQNIPAGNYWFVALLDDDGSGFTENEQFGDLISFPPPEGTLAADESVTDADRVLNVRIGRVRGNVTIDPTLASTLTDLTGDLYIGIIDNVVLDPPPAVLGYTLIPDITMSADASVPYEVLLLLENTSTNMGVVVAIFDVDESGVTGFPQTGDIVNFILSPLTPPPIFSYTTTGIDQTSNTTLIDVY